MSELGAVPPTPKDTEAERAIVEVLRAHMLWNDSAGQEGCGCDGWDRRRESFAAHQARYIAAVLAASPAVTAAEDETAERIKFVMGCPNGGHVCWESRCRCTCRHCVNGSDEPVPAVTAVPAEEEK